MSSVQIDSPNSSPHPSPPSTSPPTLVTCTSSSISSKTTWSNTTTTPTYSLASLLALAPSPFSRLRTPQPTRLGSFSAILRTGSIAEWGVDESNSSLLDGEPAFKSFIIADDVDVREVKQDGEVLFDCRDEPLAIMVDFHNDPFSSTTAASKLDRKSACSMSASASERTAVPIILPKDAPLRLGTRSPSVSIPSSRSTSSTSSSPSGDLRRNSLLFPTSLESATAGKVQERRKSTSLNAFAPPFPLPATTPLVQPNLSIGNFNSVSSPSPSPSRGAPVSVKAARRTLPARRESSTLPTSPSLSTTSRGLTTLIHTQALPASLPAKPSCLPPVFIKKESAALPQPMALPNIAPLGREWEGISALSGNERRRASGAAGELGSASWRGGAGSSLGMMSERKMKGQSAPTARPERLVKLGQGWRASATEAKKVSG